MAVEKSDIVRAVSAIVGEERALELPKPQGYAKGLRDAVFQAWEQLGGIDYLVQVGREDPRCFMTILNKLLPQSVQLSGSEDGPPIAIYFPPL